MLGLGLGLNKYHKRSGVTQTLANLVTQLGFLNAWGYESTTIAGTTTTVNDMIGALHMSNTSATSQPTDGGTFLTFDGVDDAIRAAVANYRNADTSGEFVSHIKINSGTNIFDIGVFSSSNLGGYINQSALSTNTYRFIHNTSAVRSQRGSTNISSGWFTVTSGCNGSSYYIIISGNNETLTAISGANDGSIWLDSQLTNDSIAIGGRLTSSPLYSNIDWKLGGYRAYTSIADSIAANQAIHNYLI